MKESIDIKWNIYRRVTEYPRHMFYNLSSSVSDIWWDQKLFLEHETMKEYIDIKSNIYRHFTEYPRQKHWNKIIIN